MKLVATCIQTCILFYQGVIDDVDIGLNLHMEVLEDQRGELRILRNSGHQKYSNNPQIRNLVGSTEPPSKAFLLFFLLPDSLKLNHLKSRMECGFSDIFPRHICSIVAETIGVTNYTASFGAKNVQKTTFAAAR